MTESKRSTPEDRSGTESQQTVFSWGDYDPRQRELATWAREQAERIQRAQLAQLAYPPGGYDPNQRMWDEHDARERERIARNELAAVERDATWARELAELRARCPHGFPDGCCVECVGGAR